MTPIRRPPAEYRSESTLVNGHGPATHESLTFWNCFPFPASRSIEPTVASHLPSGEHGGFALHGTLPLLIISKLFAALPTFTLVVLVTEYLSRTFAIGITGPSFCGSVSGFFGFRRASWSSSVAGVTTSSGRKSGCSNEIRISEPLM